MAERFISLEDEILFRRALHNTYKHEGMVGIYKCLGEMNAAMKITAEVARELLAEEAKRKGDSHGS